MRLKQARNTEQAAAAMAWEPPDWMPAAAGAIWSEVTASVAPGHFASGDAEVLAVYCVRTARLRLLLGAQAKRPAIPRSALSRESADRLHREIAQLSRDLLTVQKSLRLVPTSRREARETDHSLPPPLTPKAKGKRGAVVHLIDPDLLP